MNTRTLSTETHRDRTVAHVEMIDDDCREWDSWEFWCDTCDEYLIALSETDARGLMFSHQCDELALSKKRHPAGGGWK